MATIDAVLRAARARIEAADAELLLEHVLGRSRTWLHAYGDAPVAAAEASAFDQLVQRRIAGEPVAYLTGTRGFWRFDLRVDASTLVPRAETELLVECALARLPEDDGARVLDLGTGSGAVALAIACERPLARVLATDASAGALAVARDNARALRAVNVAFAQGDWWTAVGDAVYDLVVSNPPYLAEDDPHLPALRHEPRSALTSGREGLDAIRVIAAGASRHLAPGGWLLLEHGCDQGASVRALLAAAGFGEVSTAQDLEGRDRVTSGCLRGGGRASSC